MKGAKEQTPPAGLPDWWASAPGGGLSPWALAQVWALLRVSGQLPPFPIAPRQSWAKQIKRVGHRKGWYAQYCIWFDPCSGIVARVPRTAFDAAQTMHGEGKRWRSKDKKAWSRNLRTPPYAGKQAMSPGNGRPCPTWGEVRLHC